MNFLGKLNISSYFWKYEEEARKNNQNFEPYLPTAIRNL